MRTPKLLNDILSAMGCPPAWVHDDLAGTSAHRKLLAMAGGNVAQLRVLSFGDSLGFYKAKFLLPDLSAAFGKAGQVGSVTITLAGGAALGPQNFAIWPTGEYWNCPAGGSIEFSYGGGSILSDQIAIPYLIESGAGNFKAQTSLAGAAYADEAGNNNVAAAGAQSIGFITLNKVAGAFRAKVVGLSGSVKFFRPLFRHRSKPGVEWYQMDYPGSTLAQMNTIPESMMSTILNAIAPDLVLFEMREVSSDEQVGGFAAELAKLQARFDAVVPNATWVFSGAPPMQDETQNARTIETNRILRAHALANGRYYFDGYGALGDWSNVNALGWGGDGVHLADDAQRFLAARLRDESGLCAGLSLGAFGGSYGAEPQHATINTGQSGGRPFMRMAKAAGSRQFWSARILGQAANNRGPEFQATNLTDEGAENYATGFEVVPLHAHLGENACGLAVGGVVPAGRGRIEMPWTGNTALANGFAWGTSTWHYNPANVSFVITGADLEFAANGKGPVVRSPDGTRYRINVANGGALSTTAL